MKQRYLGACLAWLVLTTPLFAQNFIISRTYKNGNPAEAGDVAKTTNFVAYLLRFAFVFLLFLSSFYEAISQTTTQNFTTTRTYRTPVTVPSGSAPTGGIPVVEYMDGLGRPIQTILQQSSPTTAQDIIVGSTTYDEFGRPNKGLMPVRFDGANTGAYQDPAAVQSKAQSFYGDTSPFSSVEEFEKSPFSRVKKQLGPGAAWQTGTKKTNNAAYETNTTTVRRWMATNTSITGTTDFGVGTLSKITSTDENGNTVVDYTDKEGRTIQKEVQENSGILTTCYAYDDFGRLTYILPPKLLATGQTSFTTDDVIELVFAFRYDKRGRIVEKLTPGADWTHFVYNKLNQVVMSQNKRQRNNNQWTFTRYDALGRPIVSGLYKYTNAPSNTTLQGYFDAQTDSFYETIGGSDNGYTQSSLPASATAGATYFPLAYRFYDDYTWMSGLSGFGDGTAWAYNATDKLTGMKLRVLEPNVNTTVWLDNVFYYDDRDRVLKAYSHNFFGQINDYSFTYDGLTSDALTETSVYRRASTTTTVKNTNVFDDRGRITQTRHQINAEPEVILAEYEYDDIGRLKRKKIQPGTYRIIGEAIDQLTINTLQSGVKTDSAKTQIVFAPGFGVAPGGDYTAYITDGGSSSGSANYLQIIDYTYHIRGGLKCINCDAAGEPKLNKTENDLFSLRLDYETNIDGTAYYNGNIRQQSWVSLSNANNPRTYKYVYDKVDRLTDANYSGGKLTGENYSMTGVTYDPNGNIMSLNRKGQTSTTTGGSFGNTDQLAYTYKTASGYATNKINAIADAVTTNPDVGDFRDIVNTIDYDFYTDGSLQADRNKGITSVQYNELGLPSVLAFANNQFLRFTYDAAGNKLSKEVAATTGNYRVYEDGDITYSDALIATIRQPEGRYLPTPTGSLTGGAYEYQYHDHLGNLRVAYRQPATVRNSNLRLSAETQNAPTEEAQFTKVAATREGGIAYEGSHAIELQGEVGPSKQIRLQAGEKLTATVMGYYPQPAPEKRKRLLPIPIFWPEKTPPTSHDNVPTSGGNKGWSFRGGVLIPFSITKKQDDPLKKPSAYLQLTVTDTTGKLVHSERKYLDTVSINGWQKLKLEYVATPSGAGGGVQVSLVNDNARVAAYFDNLDISQEPPLIVQEMHYDPWGVELVGITVRGAPEDLDQFNAGSEKTYLLGDKTYYYQTDFRFYDPQRAQWGDIDLLASEMANVSPMSFSNNNPISFNDPTGLLPFNMSSGQFVGTLAGMITGGIAAYSAAKNNGLSSGNAMLAGFGGALVGGAIGYGLGSINYKAVGKSPSNIFHFASNNNDWLPLTKSIMSHITKINFCVGCGAGQLENKTGEIFESVWHTFAIKNAVSFPNYRPNRSRVHGSRNTIPDGVSDGVSIGSGGIKYIPDIMRYEVKAKGGKNGKDARLYNSTDDYQIASHILSLKKDFPLYTRKNNQVATLNLVTTSDVSISGGVYTTASSNNVKLNHFKSYYKLSKRGLIINFGVPSFWGPEFNDFAIPVFLPIK